MVQVAEGTEEVVFCIDIMKKIAKKPLAEMKFVRERIDVASSCDYQNLARD